MPHRPSRHHHSQLDARQRKVIEGQLAEIRTHIRDNDEHIVEAIGLRMRLIEEAGRKKERLGLPVVDPMVERCLVDHLLSVAITNEVNPELVRALMLLLFGESYKLQIGHRTEERHR